MSRFDRHTAFFGEEGQRKIGAARVAIVGLGGLGAPVAQELVYLGVRRFALIDGDRVEESNLNRLVGGTAADARERLLKTEVTRRTIMAIAPDAEIATVPSSFVTEAGFAAIRNADWVFGCVDEDGWRLILMELAIAYARPYLDVASDIDPDVDPMVYGGRVAYVAEGDGCLSCLGVLDSKQAGRDLQSPEAREIDDRIYGIKRGVAGVGGPSVVSINGVVASLSVTEFAVGVTGLRRPSRVLTYRADLGGIVRGTKDLPGAECYYCKGLYAKGAQANVERHLRSVK